MAMEVKVKAYHFKEGFVLFIGCTPAGKKVTCANNASYPIKGIGKILITILDGSDLCLPDVLYVPGIKKNLLSVSSLAKNGPLVIFEDDRCIVRDRENGYSLITTGTLENGLFVLDRYEKHIQLRGKLDDKVVKCIFVGYSSGSKGYRLYNPATNKIFESRDVIFAETTAQLMVAFDVPHMQTQDVFEGFLSSFVENQESQQDSKLDAPLPRKTRVGTTFSREQVDLACFSTLCDADEPDTFEQALECVQWKDAMQQEIDSIHKNHTWDLVDLPTGKKPIGTKWVFKEEVYVSQPSGFVVKGQEQKVCRLCKALYGLKQAPRAWYGKIHTYLIGQGFQNSPTKSTLYVKNRDAVVIMLTLYVDDMLLTGNNENENATFKDALRNTFEMSDLGLLHYCLGIQFVQSEDGIYMF
ncbi:hypothetical protein L7F22_041849 [Adiantum nelumboides]|nr:hypothetical protein [Adiantum nelumboides]